MELETRRIIGVAIKQGDTVYSLPKPNRHYNIIDMMVNEHKISKPISGIQGFILDTGEFVDRVSAAEIALRTGQTTELQYVPDMLFSEDLW